MISKICETRQIFTLKICAISGPEKKSDLRKLWDSGQICADRYLVHFDHFIIMGFQQSQQIESLFIIDFYSFQVQNANFMKIVNCLIFVREKKHFRGCTSWGGEKYIDLTLS